jgi:hypothetical protein
MQLPTIVNFKAYGDFVIACSVIKILKNSNNKILPELIVGQHVRSLAIALGVDSAVTFVGDESSLDVPAAFNVRKYGVTAGLKSLYGLQRSLGEQLKTPDVLFDRRGWREQFISLGHNPSYLKRISGNIYLDYLEFYKDIGLKVFGPDSVASRDMRTAIIVPGARMTHRVIPSAVIGNVAAELQRRSISVKVALLQGEKFSIPSWVPVVRVERSFSSLASVVRSTDMLVSADSLPAHLCEFYGILNFVFTPTPDWSKYWLPRSTFVQNGISKFGELDAFKLWLDARLV